MFTLLPLEMIAGIIHEHRVRILSTPLLDPMLNPDTASARETEGSTHLGQ